MTIKMLRLCSEERMLTKLSKSGRKQPETTRNCLRKTRATKSNKICNYASKTLLKPRRLKLSSLPRPRFKKSRPRLAKLVK